MVTEAEGQRRLERLPTGVAGLDEVLQGGFFRSGIYMVMGRPGTGKTTMGSQVAFNHVARGGRALYVTLLADSHDRMFAALSSMRFFDPDVLVSQLSYLSAYAVLEQDGLHGLLKLLRTSIKEFGATLLVIDGVVTAEQMAHTELDLKKFLHELQALVELFRCTALLLTGAREGDANYAERTMVDGLVQLSLHPAGARRIRHLEVLKHRGSAVLLGPHVFAIDLDGVSVYPRLESVAPPLAVVRRGTARLSSGVPAIDGMLAGGLPSGSISAVAGAPGSGKTLLGLAFLAAGGNKENGVLLGFDESPAHVTAKAASFGLDLGSRMAAKRLVLLSGSSSEQPADILCAELLEAIRATDARRLVIDDLDALLHHLASPERSRQFLAALFNTLRAVNVTVLVTQDTGGPIGAASDAPAGGYWGLFDSVLFLRDRERDGGITRTVAVAKLRDGPTDKVAHDYTIGQNGFELDGDAPGDAPRRRAGATRAPARKARARASLGRKNGRRTR